MRLAKKQGGCTVAGHTWEHDNDVAEVPDALAVELLSIAGGDYYIPGTDKPGGKDTDAHGGPADDTARGDEGKQDGSEVTEPAPATAASVTEPAPGAKPHTGSRRNRGTKVTE